MTAAFRDAPTPAARRPGRPRDERADRAILEATMQEVAEHGFGGLTVDAIAARAGVGKATIYRRWSSKEALVLDAAAALVPEPDDPDSGSIRDDLVELFERAFRQKSKEPFQALMAGLIAEAAVNPEVRQLLTTYVRHRRRMSRTVVARAIERGELPADTDPELLSDLVAGPILHRLVFTGSHVDRALIERIVDVVLRGVSATG